jgi:hypothetical protein
MASSLTKLLLAIQAFLLLDNAFHRLHDLLDRLNVIEPDLLQAKAKSVIFRSLSLFLDNDLQGVKNESVRVLVQAAHDGEEAIV